MMLSLAGSIAAAWMVCQQPVTMDAGMGTVPPAYQWTVDAGGTCGLPSLKTRAFANEGPGRFGTPVMRSSDTPGREEPGCGGPDESRRAVLYFAPDSDELFPLEAAKLVPLLHAGPALVRLMRIDGYTDWLGPFDRNRALAQGRAHAVWKMWRRLGGGAPRRPPVMNGRPACCYVSDDPARNRRAEVHVVSARTCAPPVRNGDRAMQEPS